MKIKCIRCGKIIIKRKYWVVKYMPSIVDKEFYPYQEDPICKNCYEKENVHEKPKKDTDLENNSPS